MEELVITLVEYALLTAATVMGPILLTGLTIGVSVGAIQAATQVNEPTLTFVPKVTAVGLVAGLILPWGLNEFVGIFELVVQTVASLGAS